MGCFLGCFGDAKDRRNRKQRIRRASLRGQPKPFTNVNAHHQLISVADQCIQVTQLANLVSEQSKKPRDEEQMSPSPTKKRVTFNSNVITHEHVSVFESTDSLNESYGGNALEENLNSISSKAESFPPNHRYYNARDSDDEAEDCDDSDLDYLDDSDDEDCYDDNDEGGDMMMDGQDEAWSEGTIISSTESIAKNHSGNMIAVGVDSLVVKTWLSPDEKAKTEGFESKTHARERRDYANSVLNPVENVAQWKSAKSKVTSCALKPQKENVTLGTEQTIKKPSSGHREKSDQWKNQEVAVDASLSNWLISPDNTPIIGTVGTYRIHSSAT